MDEDSAAIQQVQQGRETGLVQLMERYRGPVFRLAWRYLHSAADAADVTENAFVKVWQRAHQYRPRGSVKSWIFAIAANECRDRLRRRKQRPLRPITPVPGDDRVGESEDRLDSGMPSAAEAAVSAESVATIEAAIRQLPHKLRFPFIFCVLEDHTYDECAEVLGTNRKTVETRIYRARKRLQSQVGELREIR